MAEKQNNAVAKAGNMANKLHGAAQVVRGAVTADFLAVASGAVKLVSPKVIAGIIASVFFIVMIPILVIFSLPQVLFNWGSLKDIELMTRHEHANYLMSCYDDTDMSEEKKLWLISIDAVKNKQDIMSMSQSTISSDVMRDKTPDDVMNELGFDDNQKNWAQLMFNTVKSGQTSGDINIPPAMGGGNNGIPPEAYNDEKFAKLINEAEKYLGYPYVFGGSSPSTSFDCSGFTKYVYAHFGYNINRTASAQLKNGVSVSRSELQAGDLVFFYNGKVSTPVSHVGIYIGNGDFIHASSNSYTVEISSLYAKNYDAKYVYARRII